MSVCKKDKEILLESYKKLYAGYFDRYKEMIAGNKISGNKNLYDQCDYYCGMCRSELRGMIALLEDAGVLTWRESHIESEKIEKAFARSDLLDLFFGKEEVTRVERRKNEGRSYY